MAQISTLLASVSLAAAVVLYVKVDRLERDLGTARAGTRETRGAGVSDAAGQPMREAVAPIGGGAEAPGSADASRRAPMGSMASGAQAKAQDLSIEDRLARLEERQSTLEGGRGRPWHPGGQLPARNVDELAQRLSLTPTQRTRIEDVIGRGRQRIEDVLKIPDETGKSPFERRAEARKKLEEAVKNPGSGGFLAFATDLVSYREKKIPGRGDTYGDEIGRIRKETREEIASALDAKQQETFQGTNVDGLLGEASQVSFAYAMGDAGGDEQAGLVIEMESDVVDDGGKAPPPDATGGEGR
jgi:Spy/CpxP family protein refolding chaperone